ncbi:copper transporter 1A isoform X2 [Leptinotarsa decemlineata]|uniref:copper transporter 1A isoform X2 n=1 Tax=Leptinotarsa decemlineata TaxID=7539 RepID=UPI000C25565D|nr:high affinity copper uptake protein 1 isoform X2 [Leptinotarsa decemlineata]XP_023025441.1 high affinity copper uptake protein 1 isoform X2 [Leptinotarsa decemlineata]
MDHMDHSEHSLHQHGDMTPKPMDHSGHMGHDMTDMGSMMMPMYFFFSTKATVLFEGWKFTSTGGLIGSMIGIFFMAALYEGLKYFREYLFWRTYNSLQYRAVTLPDKATTTEEPQVVQPTMISKMHFLQTFLHMVQMVLSYFLMLIFMTYNTYLCIAIVLGAGTGYFLFGWKKSVVVDVTEHCH